MAHLAKRQTIDMTTGPLFRKLLLFILPLMATNLLQMLYNAADIMIVGLSSEPDAVGAVGSGSPFQSLVVNLFIGFSLGTDVVVARSVGAGDQEKTSRAVHTSICMSVIFGVLGGILGLFLTKPVLAAMGNTGKLLELSAVYSYVYFICLPLMSLSNFLSAILRAKGDASTPMFVLAGTGLLNVGLNLFFVLVAGLSVEGVAIATGIANGAAAVIMWIILSKETDGCRISFRKLRLYKAEFKEVCRIGFPAGVQNAMFSISNMLIQSSILQVNNALTPAGSTYAPVVKGNAAAQSIESFIFTALNAVTLSGSTFTSQNMGVRDYRRIKRVLWTITGIVSVLSVVTTVLMALLRDPLLALYDVQNAPDVLSQLAYDTAMKRILFKWTSFTLFALMNTAAGVLRGMGMSMTTAVISLIGTCAFRVAWIYTAFQIWPTLEVIYLSYGISWLLTGGAFFIMALVLLQKKIRNDRPDDK